MDKDQRIDRSNTAPSSKRFRDELHVHAAAASLIQVPKQYGSSRHQIACKFVQRCNTNSGAQASEDSYSSELAA
jgi:hypothetical protein